MHLQNRPAGASSLSPPAVRGDLGRDRRPDAGAGRNELGPYSGQGEARQRLTAFADAVFRRPVGVLWTADNQTVWLRPPAFDGANDGLALMVRCDPTPSPPPLALPSMQKVETALMGA